MRSKKYSKISLRNDDGTIWRLLFKYIIEQCNYFEYSAGCGLDYKLGVLPTASLPLNEIASEELKLPHFQIFSNNLVHFYTSKRNFMSKYSFDWVLVRLALDFQLKEFLSKANKLNDFLPDFHLTNEEPAVLMEFYNPAFYQNETAILWTVHSEMTAYILLSEEEKDEHTLKGILFVEEFEKVKITESEEIQKINKDDF